MKLRYLSLNQFREERKSTNDHGAMTHTLKADADERIIILASHMPQVRALGGHDSRLIEFVITDETIDRMSDKLSADGWDTDSFEKNPVVLWAHSHYDPPVGKAVTLDVKKKDKAIRSVTEFTPKELNELGYMVYQMYVQKFMHAVSVGFFPKEYTWVSSDSDAERARRGGIDFLKQELLEYSAVPVPANPNALAVARSAGIDTTPLKHWAEMVMDESKARNLTMEARERLEILRVASSPVGRSLILEIGDMKMPSNPTVKEIVTRRWDCGSDGHVHESQEEAETCAEFGLLCSQHTTLVNKFVEMAAIVKAGRVLSKKNEDALKAAADAMKSAADTINSVLAQVSGGEEDDEEEDEDEEDKSSGVNAVVFSNEDDDAGERGADEGQTFNIDPDKIKSVIEDVVRESMMQLTGRLD